MEKGPTIGELLAVAVALVAAELPVLSDLTKDWPPPIKWALFAALFLFFAMYLYYLLILRGSGDAPKSVTYADYLDLRQSLELGGTFNLRYIEWLSWTLNQVDAFFGDAKWDDSTSFARRLGLQTEGPTWTAASYDRCILFALVYPLAALIAIWIAFGHVGVAERALGLPEANDVVGGLVRIKISLILVGQTLMVWWVFRLKGMQENRFWAVASALFCGVIYVENGADALEAFGGALAITAVSTGAAAVAVPLAGAVAVAVAIVGVFGFAVHFDAPFVSVPRCLAWAKPGV